MDKLIADVQLLMDHMHKIECRFFTGDEDECTRPGNDQYKEGDSTHFACNCDGTISKCDFPLENL